MKLLSPTLLLLLLSGWTTFAQSGEIDGRAVLGGAIGGGAGAAVGSAVGGREGAVIGAGLGGAAGAAVATQPPREPRVTVRSREPVVVEREVVYVREENCWPPGHCKHKHKHRHDD